MVGLEKASSILMCRSKFVMHIRLWNKKHSVESNQALELLELTLSILAKATIESLTLAVEAGMLKAKRGWSRRKRVLMVRLR